MGLSLANCPGKLLYSGIDTLVRGDLYVLGFNPGGDPVAESDCVLSHLDTSRPHWSEYCDAVWASSKRRYAPGEHPKQMRMIHFFEVLGRDSMSVFCSNAIFLRSPTVSKLHISQAVEEECCEVHALLLNVVRPQFIICFGRDCEMLMRRRIRNGRLQNVSEEQIIEVMHFAARRSTESFLEGARALRARLQ